MKYKNFLITLLFLLTLQTTFQAQNAQPTQVINPTHKTALKFSLFLSPFAGVATIGTEQRFTPAFGLHGSLSAWFLEDEASSAGYILGAEPRVYPWKMKFLGQPGHPELGIQPFLGFPIGAIYDHEDSFGDISFINLGLGLSAGIQWRFKPKWTLEVVAGHLFEVAQATQRPENWDWNYYIIRTGIPRAGLNFGFWW